MKSAMFLFVFFSSISCFSQGDVVKSESLISMTKDSTIVSFSENKNWTKVKELINSGTSSNTMYKGNTPLIWASHYGDIEMIKYLLSKGADPNLGEKRTPFSVSDNNNFNTEKENYYPEVVKILTQSALSKTFLINGVKKGLTAKPTSDVIRTTIKSLLSKNFGGTASVGIEFQKIVVEDPVKQKIKVYGNAETWAGGMAYRLGYLDYFELTRKSDGKWEAQMINKPDGWEKNIK